MSRDGAVPRRLSRVSGRNGAPLAALAVAWVCYGVDFLVLRLIGGDESSLVPFTAASILVVYLATFLAGLRLFPDRGTRTLCAIALAAVTAFLLVGGVASLLALLAFALTAGYVLLRGEALRPAARPPVQSAPAQAETSGP